MTRRIACMFWERNVLTRRYDVSVTNWKIFNSSGPGCSGPRSIRFSTLQSGLCVFR